MFSIALVLAGGAVVLGLLGGMTYQQRRIDKAYAEAVARNEEPKSSLPLNQGDAQAPAKNDERSVLESSDIGGT